MGSSEPSSKETFRMVPAYSRAPWKSTDRPSTDHRCAYPLESLGADAFHPLDVFNFLEWSVLLPVFDDAVCQHVTDAIQLQPFHPGCAVDIQLIIESVLLKTLDLDRFQSPAAHNN